MSRPQRATVRVLFFGALGDRMRAREVRCEVAPTVAQLWQELTGDAAQPDGVRAARNQEFCEWSSRLEPGDEVAFMPPVCGG